MNVMNILLNMTRQQVPVSASFSEEGVVQTVYSDLSDVTVWLTYSFRFGIDTSLKCL